MNLSTRISEMMEMHHQFGEMMMMVSDKLDQFVLRKQLTEKYFTCAFSEWRVVARTG